MSGNPSREPPRVRSSLADEKLPAACIRRAAVADAAEIARLAEQLGHPLLVPELARRIAALDEVPSQCLIVAEAPGGRLLGWIQIERRVVLTAGERAEIAGLVVDAAARRRGIGRLLADAAQQWARAANLGEIVVRSNVARDAAHVFYPALGYRRLKTQHVYVKSLPG